MWINKTSQPVVTVLVGTSCLNKMTVFVTQNGALVYVDIQSFSLLMLIRKHLQVKGCLKIKQNSGNGGFALLLLRCLLCLHADSFNTTHTFILKKPL